MKSDHMIGWGEVTSRRGVRGSAMVEMCLLAPWIFFLFIGVMDVGFLTYSAICVESAARAAAIRVASDQYSQVAGTSNDVACVAAWNELSMLPNVYSTTVPGGCSGLPTGLTVVTNTLCGSSTTSITGCTSGTATTPSCADCDGTPWDGKAPGTADKTSASAQVAVTYKTIPLIPIPGVLTGQITLTRVSEARIIQE